MRVAIAVPVFTLFDYLPPQGIGQKDLRPGMRARVPFGRGERTALIFEVATEARHSPTRLKRVSQLIDPEPILRAGDLELLRWTAEYYQHPIGEVVANALPVRLRQGKPLSALQAAVWCLTASGRAQPPSELTRAPRQARLLRLLQNADTPLSQERIYRQFGPCLALLRRLEARGWLDRGGLDPAVADVFAGAQAPAPQLNREQRAAVERVTASLDRFRAHLLEGVTGSGKTEVYLALIEAVVARGCQALVLVPEIGLTPQLMQRFQRRLAVPLALLHSGLGEVERAAAWNRARLGVAGVVIGTRSSLFTPLPNLGLVVVDEEHDLSFKQQDGVRYSARDLAVYRAQRSRCPVVLGSATPSFESLKNAAEGRYLALHLSRRAGGAQAPRVELMDIRSVKLDAGVSPRLAGMVGEELAAGNQVLLFLNRRGYAPVFTCHDCGWLAQCQRCDARMTVHQSSQRLDCHHCGASRTLPLRCPECGGESLLRLGQGTERLEAMLRERFPQYGVVRIDRDATRRRGSLGARLEEIKSGKYSLLLGTQMLAKGHHFPGVTLVGVLDLDQGLFGADYRSTERMAQLLVQVAGRAGRADKPGRVQVQTRHPDHPLLQTLLRAGYGEFARAGLLERRAVQLPPYSFQALLRAEAHRAEAAIGFLDDATAAATAVGCDAVTLWGPVPAPMERRAGRYRYQLLLQAAQRRTLQDLLAQWVPVLARLTSARRVRWSIDVDPQEQY
ncbi:MAG: primosomal protein N' [Gammaproteobacteria bacterium]|nr:primosomal protein N' [Gammaproteobacteria bacterium]